jgi:hypothetical protein
VVSFTPRSLFLQGKSSWCPLHRRLGGPQSRSGDGGEEKNPQTLPEIEPPIFQPREEYGFRMFKDKLLSRMFESKREKLAG